MRRLRRPFACAWARARPADRRELAAGVAGRPGRPRPRTLPGKAPRTLFHRRTRWNLSRCADIVAAGPDVARACDQRGEVRGIVERQRPRPRRLGNPAQRIAETIPAALAGER